MSKLMDEILSKDNLTKAYHQVMKNKGASGVDRLEVHELAKYLETHGEEIIEKVRNRKYKPLPVRRVQIPKPDGSKRNLGIPSVVDRWLQQAIYQVLCPIYEEIFVETNYGFRPNRSCEKAVLKALEYMNDGYDWIVDIDLSKFFDTVNHDMLMSYIHRDINDPDAESLIRKFLVSGVLVDGTFEETKVGTPQGGNLSPLLGNIFLHELDKELMARGLRFTRYADDCIILVRSEWAANRVMNSVTRFLEKKLRLTVNVTKSKVARPQDIKYLGFSFFNRGGKYRPKPHIKSVESLKTKLHYWSKRSLGISMDIRISKINPIIRGWIQYYRICDMKRKMEDLDGWLRVRIRMCIWKQWKTPQHREKCLIKLGMKEWMAHRNANSRKGPMAIAKGALQSVLSNHILKLKGLLSLVDQFQLVHI